MDDSNGTLIIYQDELDEGTVLTLQYAKKNLKPVYLIKKEGKINAIEFGLWMEINKIKVLNVAGPKESRSEGMHAFAFSVLVELLQ